MRWLILALVLLNGLVFIHPEPAKRAYHRYFSAEAPVAPIILLDENPEPTSEGSGSNDTTLMDSREELAINEVETDEGTQPDHQTACWFVGVDTASAGVSEEAGQEILQTLAAKFEAMGITAQPEPATLQGEAGATLIQRLIVSEGDYQKLSAQLWEKIKIDWPEVIREKNRCTAVAPQNNLH